MVTEEEERNRAIVMRYLRALERTDLDDLGAVLHEDVVRWNPRPSGLGRGADGPARGRATLLRGFASNPYFAPGSMRITVERSVAEGDLVALQYRMQATTPGGVAYENYYHFLFRLESGQIAEYWEYIDTLYAKQVLFDG